MEQFGIRLVALAIGLIFFGPMMMIGSGRGLFIPSAQWQSFSFTAYWTVTVTMVAVTGLIHWATLERTRPVDDPARIRRNWYRVLTAGLLILIPFWSLGLVHGLLRGIISGPVTERLEMAATFDSYHSKSSRRSPSHWVVLRTTEHGMLRIKVDDVPESRLPREGDEVLLLGTRNWIGDRYGQVILDPDRCAKPTSRILGCRPD